MITCDTYSVSRPYLPVVQTVRLLCVVIMPSSASAPSSRNRLAARMLRQVPLSCMSLLGWCPMTSSFPPLSFRAIVQLTTRFTGPARRHRSKADELMCAGSGATASWVAPCTEARSHSLLTTKLRLGDPLYLARVHREVLHNMVNRLHHRCVRAMNLPRLAELTLLQVDENSIGLGEHSH